VLIDISSCFLWTTTAAFQSGFALGKVKFEFHLEQQLSVNSSCSMSISGSRKTTPVTRLLVPLALLACFGFSFNQLINLAPVFSHQPFFCGQIINLLALQFCCSIFIACRYSSVLLLQVIGVAFY
jgi:hypothetical protein